MADGKGKLGCGAEVIEKICFDAVGREDIGYDFGKLARIVAHVVSYYYRNLGQIGKGLLQIVGQTLSGCADGIYVHAVCAGAHDASQTACTEFEIFIERFDKRGGVLGFEHLLYFGASGLIILIRKPECGF